MHINASTAQILAKTQLLCSHLKTLHRILLVHYSVCLVKAFYWKKYSRK